MLAVFHAGACSGFLIHQLFPDAHEICWRPGQGSGEVVRQLREHTDAFLFHVNLSDSRRVPHDRPRLASRLVHRGVLPLNAGYFNLSRRLLQRTLRTLELNTVAASWPGDRHATVIVKTDPNCGGAAELKLSEQEREALGIDFRGEWINGAAGYRVMPFDAVPEAARSCTDYVVERYIDNREDAFLRAYVCGTAVVIVKAHSTLLIKKIQNDPRDEIWVFHLDNLADADLDGSIGLPARTAVARFLQASNLHFAAIDLVVDDDGAPYIIDVNTTPWGGRAPVSAEVLQCLRDGFDEGLRRRRARTRQHDLP